MSKNGENEESRGRDEQFLIENRGFCPPGRLLGLSGKKKGGGKREGGTAGTGTEHRKARKRTGGTGTG